MANTTRLGENQLHMLKTLVERGVWYPGGGWHWNNYSQTSRMMESLRKRGLAKNVGEAAGSRKERYEPTDEAKSYIETLHISQVSDEAKRTVVVMLAEHDLGWGPDMGWHYRNPAFTELVLRNLEREGLVVCIDRQKKQYAAGDKLYDLAYEYGYDPSVFDEA
jgi:hypothetical protein